MDALVRDLLLPDLKSTIPGYQLASSYRPAWRNAPVGGDFYSLFSLDPHRYFLWVGDVGGKGLEAASLALRLQPVMMALAMRPEASPATVLNRLNHFWTALDLERIVTIFAAILDISRDELLYCSAGHEPALVWQRGELIHLESHQAALTGLSTAPYSNSRQSFGPGDLLLVYTDGLTEAGMGGRQGPLGLEAVENLLDKTAHCRPDQILQTFCHAAGQQAAGQLHDDIVMIAIRHSEVLGQECVFSRRCQECCDDCGCASFHQELAATTQTTR